MKFLRPLLVFSCLALLLIAAALWWNLPVKADMASYAPADSLIYLETNSLPELSKAIQQSEVWKSVSPIVGNREQSQSRLWLLASRAGIGPVEAVITSRAQIALVVLGVDTTENADLLRVRPEVAVIVETHTAKWRMKSSAVAGIKRVAEFAYGSSVCTERSAEADYVECSESGGRRQLVGAIDGSVIVVGNSIKAVQSCLQVRMGQRPSLTSDPELQNSRRSLRAESSLAFGYVSKNSAPRLFSIGAPLLIGKAPGDQKLEQLLSESAGKIFQNIAWTSSPSSGRTEDKYQISLDPTVVKRLEPAFETAAMTEEFWKVVPDSFRALTLYRNKEPVKAWAALEVVMASKLDTVSSVIFASLLRAGLSGYGIDNPRELLATLTPPLITLRPILGDGSLLIAKVADGERLKRALDKELLTEGKGQVLESLNSEPSSEKEFTALLVDGFLVMGKTENIKVYMAQLRNQEIVTQDNLRTLQLTNRNPSATIVTYTNERLGLASLIGTLSLINGKALSEKELAEVQQSLQHISYSSTESTLNATGIERKTVSAFGQFGTLISLAQSDKSNP